MTSCAVAILCLILGALLLLPAPAHARPVEGAADQSVVLTPAQLFEYADRARDAGNFAAAEKAYRALSRNVDVAIRSEARFRLGLMLADQQKKYSDAAIEFRRILDDRPNAVRVRIELARMHAQLGNIRAAERELRAAEASGLPPEVERIIRFYSSVLNSRKSFGGSVEIAIAPDTNINRATRSDTLGTVIGDFALDKGARAKSGIGLDLRGQAYVRRPLGSGVDALIRASASADLYRDSRFRDVSAGVQAGPEISSGRDRIVISAGPGWRWYGKQPYSFSMGGSVSWKHPVGKRSQLLVEAAARRLDNKFNDLQDANNFTLSAAFDHALDAKLGIGMQLYGFREAARDPGYSTASGGVSAYLFRELGRTTLVASAGYSHLEADERLLLFPRRRVEDRFTASLAATFRTIRIGPFSPLARIKWERNRSTIEIYDYRRLSAEFGLSSAF